MVLLLQTKFITMRKAIVPALLALLAACKGGQKLSGIYVSEPPTPYPKDKDVLIIFRDDSVKTRYDMSRQKVHSTSDTTDWQIKTNVISSGKQGKYNNTIKEDSTGLRFRFNPRKRVMKVGSTKYRKIGF